MKKLAIRSLGWGVGAMALLQLPVQASNSPLNTAYSASEQVSRNQVTDAQLSGTTSFDQPLLVAAAGTLSKRSLGPGDFGQDVRILQRFLSVIGLYLLEIDGEYGPETASSVERYQAVNDLQRTGIADEETLRVMGFEFEPEAIPNVVAARSTNQQPPSLFEDNLGPGNVGSDVIALQQRLSGFGFPIFVDGIYGFETELAVRNYQNARGFRPTGIADRETLDAMGFTVRGCTIPEYPYIAAVIVDKSELDLQEDILQELFSNTNVCQDRNRQGTYINIGNFAERLPAEARVDAAAARGFRSRVIYRRTGLFR